MQTATSAKQQKKTGVAVRCYFDPSIENMGLENYGISLMEGSSQIEPLGYIEKMGIRTYLTGLNEEAPEVLALPEKEREAVRKDIRETVAKVHKMITGGDAVDPKLSNKEFWKQCALLSPTNEKFWGEDVQFPQGFTLELNNDGLFLDFEGPDAAMCILVERAIRGGGYKCLVAPSLESARKMANPPKFYLDKLEDTTATLIEFRQIKNKAKAQLELLRDTNLDKLILIARSFDPDPTQYKKSTPPSVIYLNMDRGIDGELWEKNKKAAAQRFLDLTKMEMKDLTIWSIIKVATRYRFIDQKSDGTIYFMEKGTALGRNQEEVFRFLGNPIHEDIFTELQNKVDFELND